MPTPAAPLKLPRPSAKQQSIKERIEAAVAAAYKRNGPVKAPEERSLAASGCGKVNPCSLQCLNSGLMGGNGAMVSAFVGEQLAVNPWSTRLLYIYIYIIIRMLCKYINR